MPGGKPAGMPCVQLADDLSCRLFGNPIRPKVCLALTPASDVCGTSRADAMHLLAEMESATMPES